MIDPVRAYAAQIAAYMGESYRIVTLPDGSTAYSMGYRYASIPQPNLLTTWPMALAWPREGKSLLARP